MTWRITMNENIKNRFYEMIEEEMDRIDNIHALCYTIDASIDEQELLESYADYTNNGER